MKSLRASQSRILILYHYLQYAYLILRWDDRSGRTGRSSHTCGMTAVILQVSWADSGLTLGRLGADLKLTWGQLEADLGPALG